MFLRVNLLKMSTYRINFDETQYTSFLRKGNTLLENYNQTWNKVSKVLKKGFKSVPKYNEKYSKYS